MTVYWQEEQRRALNYLEKIGQPVPQTDKPLRLIRKMTSDVFLAVNETPQEICITYSKPHLLFRGLFLLLPEVLATKTGIVEETPITEVGYSLDASRNAVMTVAALKEWIAYLAIMGFNVLYLYTEDTYEVKDLPYFGYLRGRYSHEEIQEIVAFAQDFGIEVVPSIQTLAHLTEFLKWPATEPIKDDANTLLIGEAETYQAIEKMIQTCRELYATDRIHLGMDEAYQAGLGRYLALHGYKNRRDLMIEHIDRVCQISAKYELEPMIWSDFIYKLLDCTNSPGYYPVNAEIDLANAGKLPDNLTYVHWDYGGEEVEKYETVIQHHLDFCDVDTYVFAGGAHIWNRLAPNHGKTIRTIEASIQACRNKGVKSVMLTTWGDDGQETNHWHSLISSFYYTEQIYGNPSLEKITRQFERLFGQNTFELMYLLRKFDEVDTIAEDNTNMTNISKLLLWQDLLFGLYDAHVSAHEETAPRSISTYYEELAKAIRHIDLPEQCHPIFTESQQQYALLAEVLAFKSIAGVRLRKLYMAEDKTGLLTFQRQLQQLKIQLTHLQTVHSQVWHQLYKTNGWESLELRYAGVISRSQTVWQRIEAYRNGEGGMPELLEEKIPFCTYQKPLEISGFSYRDTAQTGYN